MQRDIIQYLNSGEVIKRNLPPVRVFALYDVRAIFAGVHHNTPHIRSFLGTLRG